MTDKEESSFNDKTKAFVEWFQTNGGFISDKLEIRDLRQGGQGRGVVVRDGQSIPGEDQVLFSIPRGLVLDLDTCGLIDKIGDDLIGISPYLALVAVLMHESAKKDQSHWGPYLDILPKHFDTPMFWVQEDLNLLQGTGVVDKMGKEEAEKEYFDILLPILKEHPDLFKDTDTSLNGFHHWGSVVMSYSFDCERIGGGGSSSESEYEEDVLVKGMVPLADILNADVVECNAHLYYPEDEDEDGILEMKSIKPISSNTQVYNTYGDLSNCEMLRRYGYVKFGPEGSPYDYVDISTQLVIDVLSSRISKPEQFKRLQVLRGVDKHLFTELVDHDHQDQDDDNIPAGEEEIIKFMPIPDKFKSVFSIDRSHIKFPRELKHLICLFLAPGGGDDITKPDSGKEWYKSKVKPLFKEKSQLEEVYMTILKARLAQYYDYESKWWEKVLSRGSSSSSSSINKRNAAQVVESQVDLITKLIKDIQTRDEEKNNTHNVKRQKR